MNDNCVCVTTCQYILLSWNDSVLSIHEKECSNSTLANQYFNGNRPNFQQS